MLKLQMILTHLPLGSQLFNSKLVHRGGGMEPALRMEMVAFLAEGRCQLPKLPDKLGVVLGVKKTHFTICFVLSINRNHPMLNTRICQAGLLYVVFAHQFLPYFIYVYTYHI